MSSYNEELVDNPGPLENSPSELVLGTLAPSIAKDFIHPGDTEEQTIFSAIRWCAGHHLVQQAYCIFTEHVGRRLIELGYVRPTDAFYQSSPRDRDELIRSLCKAFDAYAAMERHLGTFINTETGFTIASLSHGSKRDGPRIEEFFSVPEEMKTNLGRVVPWLFYITRRRNQISRSDVARGNNMYSRVCRFLKRRDGQSLEPDALRRDALEALETIEKNGRAADGVADAVGESEACEAAHVTLDDAKGMLLEYASDLGVSELDINEDCNNAWAREHGKPKLTKAAFGLGDESKLNKVLAGESPEVFEALPAGVIRVL